MTDREQRATDAVNILRAYGYAARRERGAVILESADKRDFREACHLLESTGLTGMLIWRAKT